MEKGDGDPDAEHDEVVDTADSEGGQLSTLEELLDGLETRHSQEFTSIKSLAKAAEELFKATSEQSHQHAQAVQARHRMEKMLNEVEMSLVEKEKSSGQIQEQLESLLQEYPRSKMMPFVDEDARESVERDMEDELAKELIGDMRYAGPLLKAIMRLQMRTVAEFRLLQSCILLNLRPEPLSPTRFWPWAVGKPGAERLDELMLYLDTKAMQGLVVDGIELFFEDACKVPIDFTPGEPLDHASDPRHECEKMTLHTAFFTIFPTFAEKVIKMFRKFEEDLKQLAERPVMSTVQRFREDLMDFVEKLHEGFDGDFYTAFAYRQDGSLFGDLWSTLGDVSTKIEANLEDRKAEHKAWITEGVMEHAALKKNRRHAPTDHIIHNSVRFC
jgi:hypothetical protein